ncbi:MULTISPECIES: hypothetical protein [Sphingobium]|jgi:hypothetical protein|nr:MULTISPECIES: hypothetical protein [Sphingobium]WRD76138.1 hypothetical protein QQ987_15400 [Sphingobium baderi]
MNVRNWPKEAAGARVCKVRHSPFAGQQWTCGEKSANLRQCSWDVS